MSIERKIENIIEKHSESLVFALMGELLDEDGIDYRKVYKFEWRNFKENISFSLFHKAIDEDRMDLILIDNYLLVLVIEHWFAGRDCVNLSKVKEVCDIIMKEIIKIL